MKCPHCSGSNSRVVDTTHDPDGSTHRRRECKDCSKRFSTRERAILSSLQIIKQDNRRESFDRDKLLDSIRSACAKRPIASETLEGLVDRIEAQIMAQARPEVSSKVIGDMVMAGLKETDQVAYIRYAIVYMALPDVDAVRRELDRILAH